MLFFLLFLTAEVLELLSEVKGQAVWAWSMSNNNILCVQQSIAKQVAIYCKSELANQALPSLAPSMLNIDR